MDERTIDRYRNSYSDELKNNDGYRVIKGNALHYLRSAYVDDISKKAPSLGLFSFRSLLNLGML